MSTLVLYSLSLLVALIIAGGGIAFLFKQKMVVDDKGNVTHVEIPLFGKIKSNYPSVGICLIGAGLAVYTISRVDPPHDLIELDASFNIEEDAIFADVPLLLAAVPQGYFHHANPGNERSGSLSFNVDSNSEYTVLVLKLTEITEGGVARYSMSQGTPKSFEGKLAFETRLR